MKRVTDTIGSLSEGAAERSEAEGVSQDWYWRCTIVIYAGDERAIA